ncbi:MAG: hypothetical protein LBB05_01835 [Puniceicoccales bacterium]|jgi:hypothetical protein|nr:hypothetical protein [Puniceicoccales bacterium]
MRKKLNHFSLALVGGMICENANLEAGSGEENTNRELRENFQRIQQTDYEKKLQKDPVSGISYVEFERKVNRNGKTQIETVVEHKCPNGETVTWVKYLKDSRTAFPSKALEKILEQEELYDAMEENAKQAIVDKSLERLEGILQKCQNPEAFIIQHPYLLREVFRYLNRTGADGGFCATVINILVAFGYPPRM